MTEKQFAALIRTRLAKSGVKRVAVAESAGLTESSIRWVEAGKCPSIVRAHKLLRAMGLRMVIGDPAGETVETP